MKSKLVSRSVLLLVILALCTPALSQLADSAWPCAHQNLQRTSQGPNVRLDTASLMWSFDATDRIMGSPIVGLGGVVYFTSPLHLYALEMSGALKWSYELLADAEAGPVQSQSGQVYLTANNGEAYAFDGGDGTLLWRQNIAANESFAPTIGPDGSIYFGTDDYILSMDEDRHLNWHFNGDLEQYSDFEASPAISRDGVIYCPCRRLGWQTALIALSADGVELFEPFFTANVTQITPSLSDDGTIYFPVGSYLYALNPDLTQKWRYRIAEGLINSTPTITKHGSIFISSSQGRVYCLGEDGPDGRVVFFPLAGNVKASPVSDADGYVYLASEAGDICAVTPDGDPLWLFPVGETVSSQMAIGQSGELVVGLSDGRLVCLGSTDSGNVSPDLDTGTVWPATGNLTHQFRYSVRYSDPDGDAPQRVTVWIDDAYFEMTLDSGSPADGEYVFICNLGVGDHKYHFSALDAHGAWVRYPEDTSRFMGPNVTDETELPPTISLVMEKDIFKAGQMMNLYGYAENPGSEPVFVDVYVALQWFDGKTLLYLPGFGESASPLVSRVLLGAGERTAMYTIFSQALPPLTEANYAWMAALTPYDDPGTVFCFTRDYWHFTAN